MIPTTMETSLPIFIPILSNLWELSRRASSTCRILGQHPIDTGPTLAVHLVPRRNCSSTHPQCAAYEQIPRAQPCLWHLSDPLQFQTPPQICLRRPSWTAPPHQELR